MSVITPVFNGERFLEETIISVLSSLPENSEYLIIDDGSTDSTEKIVAKYSNSVRSFKQQNSGEAIAVNFGIQQSIGDYVCIVNADDLIAKDLLRNSINILDVNPKIVVTYPDWNMVDEFGKLIKSIETQCYSQATLVELGVCIPGPGAVVRRKSISEFGLRNPKYRFTGDYEAWLRLSLIGNFERIPKTLASWRRHENSMSSRQDVLKAREHIDIINDFFSKFNPTFLSYRKSLASAYYKAAMSSLLSAKIPRKKFLFLSLWNFPRSRSFLAIVFVLLAPLSSYALRLFRIKVLVNKIG